MNTKTIHFFTDKLEKHSAYIEPSDKLGFYGKRDFFKSTKDLKKFINDQVTKGAENVKFYQLELHRRTAIPFSVIILTIIAVALTTHKVRNGMGIYLVLGLLISGAFVIIQQFSSVFATKGNLEPFIGAWIPNIIFGFLAIILVIRAPK